MWPKQEMKMLNHFIGCWNIFQPMDIKWLNITIKWKYQDKLETIMYIKTLYLSKLLHSHLCTSYNPECVIKGSL